jgi:hypothetical protein
METIFSSEMSIGFKRTVRRYIPKDMTVHRDYLKGKKLSL